ESSDSLSCSVPAAMFSSRCSRLPVPGIASTCSPRCKVHANRTCAVEAPWARATAAISSCPAGLPGACGPAEVHRRHGEERHEGDPELAATPEEFVICPVGQAVLVLHAHDRGDRQ